MCYGAAEDTSSCARLKALHKSLDQLVATFKQKEPLCEVVLIEAREREKRAANADVGTQVGP